MLGLGNTITTGAPQSYSGEYSALFDGVENFAISQRDVAALQPDYITVSVWVKPPLWNLTGSTRSEWFIGCVGSRSGWGIFLDYNSGSGGVSILKGYLFIEDSSSSGTPDVLLPVLTTAATEALDPDVWHHVALTYDGTTAKLYIDGTHDVNGDAAQSSGSAKAVSWADSSGSTEHTRAISFGADTAGYFDAHNFYEGYLDDAAYWNEALTAANITKVYNSGSPFDLTSDDGAYDNSNTLVGYWRFAEGTGVTVEDSSTKNNTIGVIEMPGIVYGSDAPVGEGTGGNAWQWTSETP